MVEKDGRMVDYILRKQRNLKIALDTLHPKLYPQTKTIKTIKNRLISFVLRNFPSSKSHQPILPPQFLILHS